MPFPGDDRNKITTYFSLHDLREDLRKSLNNVPYIESNIQSGITSDKYVKFLNYIKESLEINIDILNKLIVVPKLDEIPTET